jgi:hypothetical protein
MNLADKRKRWERMLVQAAHLAEHEQLLDAVGRARLCAQEVEAELAGATGAERSELEIMQFRAARRLSNLELAYEEWKGRVKAREQAYRAHEEKVYHEPLPAKGLD